MLESASNVDDGRPAGRLPPAVPRLVERVSRHRSGAGAVVLITLWPVLAGLFMLCGEVVEHSPAILRLDTRITIFVVAHRTPELTQFMKALTWAGSWLAALSLAVVVAILTWRRRLPVAAIVAVLAAWLGEQFAVTVTKSVVQRPRPPEAVRLVATHGWSFPSGHTANTMVVFTTTAALVAIFVHRRLARVVAWTMCALATLLVGFSRIELGAHWTTDVATSLVWTASWLLLVAMVPRPGPSSADPPSDTVPA
jgi:undecaprenyl-diphosphatase